MASQAAAGWPLSKRPRLAESATAIESLQSLTVIKSSNLGDDDPSHRLLLRMIVSPSAPEEGGAEVKYIYLSASFMSVALPALLYTSGQGHPHVIVDPEITTVQGTSCCCNTDS